MPTASVYSDDSKCVGCNQCIAACPVEDANSSFLQGDESRTRVDEARCIRCGACLNACGHGARAFLDDTDDFFEALARGEAVSVVVAPSFRVNFAQPGRLLGWLKAKGVRRLFDVALGADITTWAYLRALEESGLDSVIAQPCPAIVNYVERYLPALMPRLAPVHSPMSCTAVYARRYRGVTDKLAFISPCVGKGTEIHSPNTDGLIQFNVTFASLLRRLERDRQTLDAFPEADFDDLACGLGLVFSRPGGLRENVEYWLPGAFVRQIEGPRRAYPYLRQYARRLAEGKPLPTLVDILSCEDGCSLGTGTRGDVDVDDADARLNDLKARKLAERGLLRDHEHALWKRFDKVLRPQDFARRYGGERGLAHYAEPSQEELESTFQSMRKLTPESRVVNCTACGLSNCEAMARAIWRGLNVRENCIYFNRHALQEEHAAAIEQAQARQRVEERQRIADELKQAVSSITGSASDLSRANDCGAQDLQGIAAQATTLDQNAGALQARVQGMRELLEHFSSATEQIVEVAEETNVLALNAAIEAARAGDQGKGFSVVAGEVRKLAEASKITARSTIEHQRGFAAHVEAISRVATELREQASSVNQSLGRASESAQQIAHKSREVADTARRLADQ